MVSAATGQSFWTWTYSSASLLPSCVPHIQREPAAAGQSFWTLNYSASHKKGANCCWSALVDLLCSFFFQHLHWRRKCCQLLQGRASWLKSNILFSTSAWYKWFKLPPGPLLLSLLSEDGNWGPETSTNVFYLLRRVAHCQAVSGEGSLTQTGCTIQNHRSAASWIYLDPSEELGWDHWVNKISTQLTWCSMFHWQCMYW